MKFIANAGGETASIGGKAGALAALAAQDLPIPDWIALTPIAFEHS